MSTDRTRSGKRRTNRLRRVISRQYIEDCKALQRRISQERKGELMPDSTDVIRAMRDGDVR